MRRSYIYINQFTNLESIVFIYLKMGSKFKKGIFDDVVQSTLEVWLEDTRSKGDSTSQTRRLEIQPTTPEAFNVRVDEVNECENPQVQ